MEQKEKIVSGGSGSSTGGPIEIDYKKLIEEVRLDRAKQIEGLGGVLTAAEIIELTGMSSTHVRDKLSKLRKQGHIRAISSLVNGARGWLYSAKDIYELYKESPCLNLEQQE